MSYKKFLVPVSAVLATFLPAKLQATSVSPVDRVPGESTPESNPTTASPSDTVLKTLQYISDTELHNLVLHKSDKGVLHAGHGSHSSHASHASHASHRSGY